MSNVEKALEVVMQKLDFVTDPVRMTKEEYKELLDELMTDISGRLDEVEEELGIE